MKVLKITFSWNPFRVLVKLQALKNHRKCFGSIFGEKIFWINEGELVSVNLPRSMNLDVGDTVSFTRAVMEDQTKFYWNYL